MDSASYNTLKYWGTILGSLLFVFSVFSVAHAQEETTQTPPPDIEAVMFEGEFSDDQATTASDSVDLTPKETVPVYPETLQAESEETVSVKAVKDISVQLAVFGFLLLMLLICVAFLVRTKEGYPKKLTFWSMVFVIVVPSVFFIASTIYVNLIADTKGPVHWHADFRIFACGVEYEPPEPPHRLSNKTGTAEIHQHVDKRLHIEGVLVDMQDGSLANFFAVQGGKLTENAFLVPHAGGHTWYRNGDECPNGSKGVWNTFLYTVDEETNEISKRKLAPTEVPGYVLSPYITVPPGDCVIFEFGPEKADTEYICDFYQVDINKGELIPTWTQ